MNKPQLFFLHFGGGNLYSYQFLFPYLTNFDIIPLELPGRGNRMDEPLIRDYEDAISDYYRQISKKVKKGSNIVIYGHSMGAILAWEITKKLEENGIFPIALIVSGSAGAGALDRKERHKLSKNEFVMELKKFGGITESFLENEELFDFFEPVLRADFEVLEKEEIRFHSSVKTPVIALMGSREKKVSHISNWQKYCSGHFSSKIMDGDHFFIYKHSREIAEIITKSYDRFCASS